MKTVEYKVAPVTSLQVVPLTLIDIKYEYIIILNVVRQESSDALSNSVVRKYAYCIALWHVEEIPPGA
jgi:hypothetical protein